MSLCTEKHQLRTPVGKVGADSFVERQVCMGEILHSVFMVITQHMCAILWVTNDA
jgi:hypothetical protein